VIGGLFNAFPDTSFSQNVGLVGVASVRILGAVDVKGNRSNGLIVAISLDLGMIPLIAPGVTMWLPTADPLRHPAGGDLGRGAEHDPERGQAHHGS
jgi:xanthine/uracil permease